MTPTQTRSLNEIRAACDEVLHYWPHRDGWVRAYDLSGSREERSSTTIKTLLELGYVEGHKHGIFKQGQWSWRITTAGREALPAALELLKKEKKDDHIWRYY